MEKDIIFGANGYRDSAKTSCRKNVGDAGISIKRTRFHFNSTFVVGTCFTILVLFASTSVCRVVDGGDVTVMIRSDVKNTTVLLASTSTTSTPESPSTLNRFNEPKEFSEDEDYYYSEYYDSGDNSTDKRENWRRKKHDSTKLAQVIVYFTVIILALAGVLVKYFITQYETSQMKAQEQLHYQRLDNQRL